MVKTTPIGENRLLERLSAALGANDVRWAFGVGPRLQLPFGPLRADFTWWPRLDRQLADAGHPDGKRARGRFQFAIGPAF